MIKNGESWVRFVARPGTPAKVNSSIILPSLNDTGWYFELIITGALWGDRVFGKLWFWDPKETWSFITWLIFLAYLHARYTLDWKGRRAAILAIIGFMAVLFTYVGVDFLLPQIHGTM